MMRAPRHRTLRGFLADTRGAAAAELMLWVAVLIVPALSVVDLGIYAVKIMEVNSASVQAVEAARQACGFQAVPMTDGANCTQTTLNNAISTAAQSTSLGANVSVQTGYPQEQYYCVQPATVTPPAAAVLVAVGTAGTSGTPPVGPKDCSSVVANSATAPGDYLKVAVTYAYTPAFPGISLSGALPSPITATSWLRVQ
jgi:Flp pilus assembly protein TadG